MPSPSPPHPVKGDRESNPGSRQRGPPIRLTRSLPNNSIKFAGSTSTYPLPCSTPPSPIILRGNLLSKVEEPYLSNAFNENASQLFPARLSRWECGPTSERWPEHSVNSGLSLSPQKRFSKDDRVLKKVLRIKAQFVFCLRKSAKYRISSVRSQTPAD